jgi:predicted Zn-dependent peptidase
MTILVLTDIEVKALKFILKDYYKTRPDSTTKKIITKLKPTSETK